MMNFIREIRLMLLRVKLDRIRRAQTMMVCNARHFHSETDCEIHRDELIFRYKATMSKIEELEGKSK